MRSSKERLAEALQRFGADDLAARAREGYYDDIETDLPYPKIKLVEDLLADAAHRSYTLRRRREIKDFIAEVNAGEYDNTSEEWARLL